VTSPAARAQTVLHLAETANIAVQPDELVASLRAETTAPTPAEAQRRVNAMMADALGRVHQAGVSVSTGNYTVWHLASTPPERADRWQAAQGLALHSKDGPAMLTLVGELQQHGLATGSLAWQLSDEASRVARQHALEEALRNLRARADAAAALLGLQFDAFKEVRLDVPGPGPVPRMMSAAASFAPAQPPSVEAEQVIVSATAEAEVLLKPR